ncbi:GbsR/MarR family transcriptional regulator [Microbacterium murale]|uniref:DNA-binding transcriptional regulator GbsR (MarR family) n=1 Tax=Microbacterium murale TaxID=1081040 RepID=A0ABU0P510_9MICO|nr:transcriptional regulator [Microbacterium murale]MDQ0641992.1 DNA-binding transcriptional regulator GbsR (MarR family) [Microbacterium murale]
MDDERQRFVNTVGDLLTSWNLSRATGRVYGYLLISAEPASSDQLRAVLSLSTGAVSASVRELVSWGLARTIPQPGSRRLLIEAAGGFEQLLAASHERARAFVRTLRAGEDVVEGEHAVARLRDVTDLFEAYIDSGERMLRERT